MTRPIRHSPCRSNHAVSLMVAGNRRHSSTAAIHVLIALLTAALAVVAVATPSLAEEIIEFREIGKNQTIFKIAQRFFGNHAEEDFRKPAVKNPNVIRKNISYVKTDLNGDGIPEIFLLYSLAGFCSSSGAGGCPIFVLQRRKGVWRQACEIQGFYITLLDEWDGSYRRVNYTGDLFGTRLILHWDSDYCWVEERDKDGNTVLEYGRH